MCQAFLDILLKMPQELSRFCSCCQKNREKVAENRKYPPGVNQANNSNANHKIRKCFKASNSGRQAVRCPASTGLVGNDNRLPHQHFKIILYYISDLIFILWSLHSLVCKYLLELSLDVFYPHILGRRKQESKKEKCAA